MTKTTNNTKTFDVLLTQAKAKVFESMSHDIPISYMGTLGIYRQTYINFSHGLDKDAPDSVHIILDTLLEKMATIQMVIDLHYYTHLEKRYTLMKDANNLYEEAIDIAKSDAEISLCKEESQKYLMIEKLTSMKNEEQLIYNKEMAKTIAADQEEIDKLIAKSEQEMRAYYEGKQPANYGNYSA